MDLHNEPSSPSNLAHSLHFANAADQEDVLPNNNDHHHASIVDIEDVDAVVGVDGHDMGGPQGGYPLIGEIVHQQQLQHQLQDDIQGQHVQQHVQLVPSDAGPSDEYRSGGMQSEDVTKKKSRASRAAYMREYRKRKSMAKSPAGSVQGNGKLDQHIQSTPSRMDSSFSHQDPSGSHLDSSDHHSKKQKMESPSPSASMIHNGTPSPQHSLSHLTLPDTFPSPMMQEDGSSAAVSSGAHYQPQHTTFHHPHHLDVLPYPRPQFLFHLECYMESFRSIGKGPYGERFSVVFKGGQFEGPQMRGKIVPGGGDWEIVEEDGTAHLDTRYVLETHDGASIYIQTKGTRAGPPNILKALGDDKSIRATDYVMRLQCTFETGDNRYQWLNKAVCIASSARCGNQVVYDCYQIL